MISLDSEELVAKIKRIVTDVLPLSKLSDEELSDEIEQIVDEQTRDRYFPINEKVQIAQQVYSSIRGFGILDSIISDDAITEIMINGPDEIFIEKAGKLHKINERFESQKDLRILYSELSVWQDGKLTNQTRSAIQDCRTVPELM